jgi:hypothetical protein
MSRITLLRDNGYATCAFRDRNGDLWAQLLNSNYSEILRLDKNNSLLWRKRYTHSLQPGVSFVVPYFGQVSNGDMYWGDRTSSPSTGIYIAVTHTGDVRFALSTGQEAHFQSLHSQYGLVFNNEWAGSPAFRVAHRFNLDGSLVYSTKYNAPGVYTWVLALDSTRNYVISSSGNQSPGIYVAVADNTSVHKQKQITFPNAIGNNFLGQVDAAGNLILVASDGVTAGTLTLDPNLNVLAATGLQAGSALENSWAGVPASAQVPIASGYPGIPGGYAIGVGTLSMLTAQNLIMRKNQVLDNVSEFYCDAYVMGLGGGDVSAAVYVYPADAPNCIAAAVFDTPGLLYGKDEYSTYTAEFSPKYSPVSGTYSPTIVNTSGFSVASASGYTPPQPTSITMTDQTGWGLFGGAIEFSGKFWSQFVSSHEE